MARKPLSTDKLTQISVRMPQTDIAELDAMGRAAQPVPASVNAMIRVAVRDYIQRHKKGKQSLPTG